MAILEKSALKELVEKRHDITVSLFMPVQREPDKQQENRIRLKTLLKEAEQKLEAEDICPPDWSKADSEALLAPAETLMANGRFWSDHSTGLAIFLAPEFSRIYRLPLNLPELLIIGEQFHVKPLLPIFNREGRFYVLALSQNHVRLLYGTPNNVHRIELDGVPTSKEEALFEEDPETRGLQFHTSTRAGAPTELRGAVHHGHELSVEEKGAIKRYFREVEKGLQPILQDETAPLVLAGVKYLFPLYAEVNTYPHLFDDGIPGNPEEKSDQQLHEEAKTVLEPYFKQRRREEVAQFHNLVNTEQASNKIEEIVPAAQYGRVDTLFTTVGHQRWGTFNKQTGKVELHDTAQPGDQDLLSLAAALTFLNGGKVYAVDPEAVPEQADIAAIYRY